MLSALCEQEEHETCFEDELDGCRCACHPEPLDGAAGESTGACRAQDPAAGRAPVSRRVARAAAPGGPVVAPHSPLRAAAGGSTPAGGAHPTQAGIKDAPPAGSRTYTIALPAGMKLLNANDRDMHWARRKRITRELRETAGWKARIQHVPALQRAHVLGIYEPPDRRRRDPANLYPSFKACVDGLVDVGVLPDDDAAHLDGPDMRLGEVCRHGRLVLHVTELAGTRGAA